MNAIFRPLLTLVGLVFSSVIMAVLAQFDETFALAFSNSGVGWLIDPFAIIALLLFYIHYQAAVRSLRTITLLPDDFLSDTFGACRKFRILAVNDDCCRENLSLTADTSISGTRVARELDALVRIYGKPACIVSDNGTEFTSKAILK